MTKVFGILLLAFVRYSVSSVVPLPKDLSDNSSSHPGQTLHLKATLTPLGYNSINVSITNVFSEDISVLSWNNHFQLDQSAAHGSFVVVPVNSTESTLTRGHEMGQYLFERAWPSHFVNISSGATYSDMFDLTRLFKVPSAGEYRVSLD